MQVRISFGLAIACAVIGVLQMPGGELDRAFLAIGMFFCLFASFTVAKTQRDNRDGQVDTAAWVIAVWIAFAAAILLTGWGLWRMSIEPWQKYYMLVTWLFMVSSTFTLAKTVRDAQEADLLEQRSARARSSGETDAA
ncbi:MAG: YiaA/YiaB family inner membrane protein [Giesbergeria sp.]